MPNNAPPAELRGGIYTPPLSPREFARIQTLVYERAGIDLREGKQTLVSARLGKQLRESGFRSYADFLASVESDKTGEALTALIDALTTNYTFFFREPGHFHFLRNKVLKDLLAAGAPRRNRIDVWCAAAATGEEPYTLGMVLLESCGAATPRLLATDISTRALDKARRGVYPADRFEGVPQDLQRKYWLRGEGDSQGLFKAKSELAKTIEFARLNLIEPFKLSVAFPVIFCRNVMIYFDKPTQQRVVDRMCQFLEPGGYLFLGHSESLSSVKHCLEYAGPAVYRKPGKP